MKIAEEGIPPEGFERKLKDLREGAMVVITRLQFTPAERRAVAWDQAGEDRMATHNECQLYLLEVLSRSLELAVVKMEET